MTVDRDRNVVNRLPVASCAFDESHTRKANASNRRVAHAFAMLSKCDYTIRNTTSKDRGNATCDYFQMAWATVVNSILRRQIHSKQCVCMDTRGVWNHRQVRQIFSKGVCCRKHITDKTVEAG